VREWGRGRVAGGTYVRDGAEGLAEERGVGGLEHVDVHVLGDSDGSGGDVEREHRTARLLRELERDGGRCGSGSGAERVTQGRAARAHRDLVARIGLDAVLGEQRFLRASALASSSSSSAAGGRVGDAPL